MAEPFLGEVRLFSFAFPPKGWALCNGQLLPINQNQRRSIERHRYAIGVWRKRSNMRTVPVQPTTGNVVNVRVCGQ